MADRGATGERATGAGRPLRAAVVGAGLMGGWHARYAARAGAQVTAIVDPRGAEAARLRERFPGACAFEDLTPCLASGGLDVVHVCTDTASHASLIEAALLAGKHVLVEKPVTRSIAELEPLAELARQRGLRLMPAHQLPQQRGFRSLRAGLGSLGELLKIEYAVCSAGGEGHAPEARAEILIGMLPHPVSLLGSLLGAAFKPESLELLGCDDDALRLAGSAGALQLDVFLSLRARPTRHELAVIGTRATAWLDLFHGFCFLESGGASWAGKLSRPFRRAARVFGSASVNLVARTLRWEPAYPGLLDLIRGFYRAVEGGAPLPVGEGEMRASVALMDAVRARRYQGRAR